MAYIAAIVLAFLVHWLAQVIYVAVALVWLLPDPRLERAQSARASTGTTAYCYRQRTLDVSSFRGAAVDA